MVKSQGNGRKRILVLTSRFPYPPVGGEKLRIFHLIENLSMRYEIDLCSLYSRESELAGAEGLRPFCARITTIRIPRLRRIRNAISGFLFRRIPLQVGYYTDAAALREAARSFGGDYDLVLVHLIRMFEYARRFRAKAVALEYTDSIAMNYFRIALPKSARELAYFADRRRTLRYELDVSRQIGAGILVSETDREFLRSKGAATSRLHVIRNGTRLAGRAGARPERGVVAFVGNMRSSQNEDMCLHFASHVWPLVRARFPTSRFRVIGANPSLRVCALDGREGIEVTGEVPDAAALLEKAEVSVCPMRYGAGIQNKILESMALGVPVVTTGIGLEGIDAEPGSEVLVADDPQGFAEAVCRLLGDAVLRESLGRRSAGFISANYRWEAMAEKYARVLDAIMPNPGIGEEESEMGGRAAAAEQGANPKGKGALR